MTILTEHGLRFRPPEGCRIRRGDIRQVVLHWTGGEGSALQVYRTLAARRLGIHYVVDAAGVVWQMCDEAHVAYHVGAGNEGSIGIEIVCAGVGPVAGRQRYAGCVHGKKLVISDFYDCQKAAVVGLVNKLVERYEIPRAVPREMDVLPDAAGWTGVCGHLHWSQRKVDPGPRIFHELTEVGYVAV